MRMPDRADSFLNRFINSLVQRSTRLKKEALKLVKSFSMKQRNMELRSF